MKKKLISIILPVFNGEEFLKHAIKSVLNQSYSFFELIIVDDCSTDNSLEIINSYAQKDERIIVIQNKKNKKLPATLNIGHKIARGDYHTWTSDDNLLKPDFLKYMLNSIIDKQVDVVYSNYDVINANNVLRRTHKAGPTERLLFGNVIGASFLYKKEVFQYLNGYNENLFLLEDYDFWLRASLNFKFYHLNKNLYDYRLHISSLTNEINFNKLTNVKYKDALSRLFNNISDKFDWNEITSKFLINNFLNKKMDIKEYFNSRGVIESDILNYNSGKFNMEEMLFEIKLMVRKEIISKHYNIKTLFLILRKDKTLLLNSKFSKKTTVKYILKSIFK